MFNNLVCRNLVNLRNASRAHKIYTDLFFNNFFVRVLNYLYKKGIIAGFLLITRYKLRIFLKFYKDKGVLNGVAFYDKRFSAYSYKALVYLYRHSMFIPHYLYLFTTSKGLFNLQEILFHYRGSLGGIMYCYLKL